MALTDSLLAFSDQLLEQLVQPEQVLALASAAVAGLLIIISAFVRTMIPLRWLAVASNLGFVIYGLVHPSPLMVALHAVLLPINLWRVWQMISLTRYVTATVADVKQLEVWLRPYMRSRRHPTGHQIFSAGEQADRLYFLAAGKVELSEVGRVLTAGQIFGEIAFFSPDRRRTSGARCLTRCTLLSIDEATFWQLAYQNPEFGLQLIRLIAGRLSDDVKRLQTTPDQATPAQPT